GLELFTLATLPVARFPLGKPLADSLSYIDTIGKQLDLRRTLKRLEPLDNRGELHAIVSGHRLSPRAFESLTASQMPQYEGPSPGAWIATTSPIGKQVHFCHGPHHGGCGQKCKGEGGTRVPVAPGSIAR